MNLHQTEPVSAGSATINFAPAADSYVSQSTGTANYGSNTSLRVDGTPVIRSYLRFDVRGLPAGTVSKATLSVFANSASTVGFSVRKVADNTWQESQIHYNNAPALGSLILTSAGYAANAWVNLDVTPYIQGNGSYSLALSTGSATATNLAARESGSYAPKLMIQVTTSVPATQAPTSTRAASATPSGGASPTALPTRASTSVVVPSGNYQPAFPIRAAFYYPWFPDAWNQSGINPFTNYTPTLGYYDSGSVSVVQNHIKAMTYGNIQAGILSWWGQGHHTDRRVNTILNATGSSTNPNFRWAIYHENESLGDPSQSQIQSDLNFIKNNYAGNGAFLKVNGKFVVFVYAANNDVCGMADRWVNANKAIGSPAYIVLKVFPGYLNCGNQPDSWHQYSPAVPADHQAGYSYAISPGFWLKGQSVRLGRDLNRWISNVKAMVASGEKWQLVTTFNEWGEGTIVESASQWASASGYGQYLDALHNNGGSAPAPQPTATRVPATAVPTQVVPTGRPTVAPTTAPAPTQVPPTATPPATNLTKINLTKGPQLVYMGNNTTMKIWWQWTSNITFRVDWGTDASYSTGSANVTASDTTNRIYSYTITGLTPGQKYYYRVVTGSQYSGGSFLAAPPASATTLKFFSYGDTRTNGSQHNAVSNQLIAQYKADPALQTFNLNPGDLVTNGDTESNWAGEFYATSLLGIREEMANISVLPVMGNHEASGNLFKRYFPMPFVAGRYWSFDYGPAHVVMLDQYTAYSSGSAQYNWLKADLAGTTKKWKIVLLHEPGWTAGGSHGNNTTVQNVLQPLFAQYQVAVVLGGHNHYYARANVNGVVHLTVGTGGAPTYAPQSGQPNVVKTYQGLGLLKFEINGSTMTGTFISSNGSTQDTFSLSR